MEIRRLRPQRWPVLHVATLPTSEEGPLTCHVRWICRAIRVLWRSLRPWNATPARDPLTTEGDAPSDARRIRESSRKSWPGGTLQASSPSSIRRFGLRSMYSRFEGPLSVILSLSLSLSLSLALRLPTLLLCVLPFAHAEPSEFRILPAKPTDLRYRHGV